MSQGDHAADDGSFARSAGVHAGRAAILIAAALAIGFLVLDDGGTDRGASPPRDISTVDVPDSTTTTVLSTTTTVAVRPADQVKVIALNATNTTGVAAKVADQLRALKYNVLASANATATAKAAETASVVYYSAGYNREALIIAQQVGIIGAARVKPLGNPPPATDLRGANVVVLVKEDLGAARSTTTLSTTTTRKP